MSVPDRCGLTSPTKRLQCHFYIYAHMHIRTCLEGGLMVVFIDLSGTTWSVSTAVVVARRITRQPNSSSTPCFIGGFSLPLYHTWWLPRVCLHVCMLYLYTSVEKRELFTDRPVRSSRGQAVRCLGTRKHFLLGPISGRRPNPTHNPDPKP